MSRIAVIGAGSWGTALAISLARQNRHQLTLWAHSPSHADEMAERRENARYLPGFPLPAELRTTASLADGVEDAEIILCVTPSQALRATLQQMLPTLRPKQILLSASKGVEENTYLRMSEIMAELSAPLAGNSRPNPIGHARRPVLRAGGRPRPAHRHHHRCLRSDSWRAAAVGLLVRLAPRLSQ